jgi:alpha-L-fucosidase
MTEEAAKTLQEVADQYPAMLTNNRLYRPWPGEFSTPEQYVPPTGLDYDWEVCMTMNTSWGYKHYDRNWKASEALVRMLVDIASKGGNLLLNVGPTAEGEIPEPSIERLQAIGQWMDVNGESIHGTEASPFFKLPWGRCTSRKTADGTTLYLHVFNWPEDRLLRVPAIQAEVEEILLLADREQKLSSGFEAGDLLITLPAAMPDPVNTVVVVECSGALEVESNMPSLKDGKILLPADFADIHNPGYGTHALLTGSGPEARITNWVDARARLEWMFQTTEVGTYALMALMHSSDSNSLTFKVGEEELETEIQTTGNEFTEVRLGEIEISEAGNQILTLRPVREAWTGMELGTLTLVKQ